MGDLAWRILVIFSAGYGLSMSQYMAGRALRASPDAQMTYLGLSVCSSILFVAAVVELTRLGLS